MKGAPATELGFQNVSRGVIGGGTLSILIKVLALISSMLLARNLGPEGFGIYAYAMSVIAVLGIPVHLGLPQFIVREVSIYLNRNELGKLRGLIAFSSLVILSIGALLAFLGWLAIDSWFSSNATLLPTALKHALILLPILGLNAVWSSSLRGFGYVVIAHIPDEVLRQTLFVLSLAVVILAYKTIDPIGAISLQIVAVGCSCVAGFILVRYLGSDALRRRKAKYSVKGWLVGALPFTVLAGAFVIAQQVDILMLGIYSEVQNVGIYRVSSQMAGLTMFGLSVVNVVIAPRLARLNDRRDYKGMQEVVTLGSKISSAFAIPAVIILIVFGNQILSGVFGEEFTAGYLALSIITFGQLVNAVTGPVGYVLNMSGYAWYSMIGVGLGTAANVLLNWFLIPTYGMEGAAIATVISLLVWNGSLCYFVYRFTGVVSIAFLGIGK